MRVVMIDSYDSFTFNLVQQIEVVIASRVEVIRNDEFEPAALLESRPDAVVISPGPGTPRSAGRVLELIEKNRTVPLLGVCLGHQAIGEAFGARIIRGREPVHGKTSLIRHTGANLFEGCPDPVEVTRYHSLVIERESLPDELSVDAEAEDGTIMAITHRSLPLWGVQFHPESYGTKHGDVLIRNFASKARLR